jgi:hypothetical protein
MGLEFLIKNRKKGRLNTKFLETVNLPTSKLYLSLRAYVLSFLVGVDTPGGDSICPLLLWSFFKSTAHMPAVNDSFAWSVIPNKQ